MSNNTATKATAEKSPAVPEIEDFRIEIDAYWLNNPHGTNLMIHKSNVVWICMAEGGFNTSVHGVCHIPTLAETKRLILERLGARVIPSPSAQSSRDADIVRVLRESIDALGKANSCASLPDEVGDHCREVRKNIAALIAQLSPTP